MQVALGVTRGSYWGASSPPPLSHPPTPPPKHKRNQRRFLVNEPLFITVLLSTITAAKSATLPGFRETVGGKTLDCKHASLQKEKKERTKKKSRSELRRVRHTAEKKSPRRDGSDDRTVHLTSDPVHVGCHDCPGPPASSPGRGRLCARWRCRSSTAAAVCWKMED